METLTSLGLILIGVAMGFILTKGYLLNKEIDKKSKEAKDGTEKK